jgi:hypothetical protein
MIEKVARVNDEVFWCLVLHIALEFLQLVLSATIRRQFDCSFETLCAS